jgi:hypothetical protein
MIRVENALRRITKSRTFCPARDQGDAAEDQGDAAEDQGDAAEDQGIALV